MTYALQDSTGTVASPAALTGARTVGGTSVVPVRHADDDSTADPAVINAVYADEDRFRVTGALYSYDDGDTFINAIPNHADEGNRVSLDAFEGLIKPGSGDTAGTVEVVFYDDDGISIFRVTLAGS